MHIKQRKNKKWKTLFKNCKRFFVFVFDILSAIRREQLLSLSEGQRATALEAKGHRLSQVPRAERWGWRGGGAAARDEPPSLSLRHRERGGGKSMLVKTWRQTQKQQTSDNMTLTTGSQIQKRTICLGVWEECIFFFFSKNQDKNQQLQEFTWSYHQPPNEQTGWDYASS